MMNPQSFPSPAMETSTSPKHNPMQITACLLFFLFQFYFMIRKKYMIAAICAVAFASYLAMNLRIGLLQTYSSSGNPNPNPQQQDYMARYVDWSITTPLLLVTLLRACKITNPSLYVLVLTLDILMIYMGYLAAVTHDAQKLIQLFCASSFFYVLLFGILFTICFSQLGLCLFLFFAWLVYPFLWILHRIPTTQPFLNNYNYDASIAALDVFSKIGYGLLLPL